MRTFDLFLSHSWTYGGGYERLAALLRERSDFAFRTFSVPKDDPVHDARYVDLLREVIRSKMSPCSVVLVLAGVYATRRRWIDEEIRLAKDFDPRKKIVAIEPWGSGRTSAPVRHAADRLVEWKTDSVVEAIREVA